MLKALLVEDNRIFRETFKKDLLGRFPDIALEEEENGEEAMEKISAAPPDLIFMDIRLPGANGFHLTRRIKSEFPWIRVAVLTSYDLPEYRQAAMQYGADYFWVKDSFREEVEAVVKSMRASAA